MKECTKCRGYKPDRSFYTIGPNRRMSECSQCNVRRKAKDYVPSQRDYNNLDRDQRGRFRRAA